MTVNVLSAVFLSKYYFIGLKSVLGIIVTRLNFFFISSANVFSVLQKQMNCPCCSNTFGGDFVYTLSQCNGNSVCILGKVGKVLLWIKYVYASACLLRD